MKVIAINGSPRKEWNTATLINKALEGAKSQGAETELIHLYDLDYKGCKSCFSCKTKGSKSYGQCSVDDDLKDVFKKVEEADALILGSPVYLGNVSGEMKSFIERLIFQYLIYSKPLKSLFSKNIKSRFIYSMNVTQEQAKESGYYVHFDTNEMFFKLTFGDSESFYSFDTYQFKDYSKVVVDYFDYEHKANRREKVFPRECENAFNMGENLVQD
jgi:multimeric flavodoxin WrbA